MDEIWEKAVETALDGQTEVSSVRNLTLDGTVKCINGRLAPPSIFEKFPNLQHLSIANIGVSSLEQFPRLKNLQKLILSDNRISGGLEFLVEAGLESLRDLDLSNNRIGEIVDLRPLAELRIVSLDLYECPVTRVKDYRARVFGLIKSLRYLDKMDAEENERPESDDEEEDEEEEDAEEEEDDPGSGEIDGDAEGVIERASNGNRAGGGSEGVVEVDEDEESDADEEELEMEIGRGVNGVVGGVEHQSNGFSLEPRDEEDEDEEDDDFIDEIDEDESEDDVVEVHEIEDSDDEEDVVEDEDDGEDDDDDDDDDDDEDDEDEEEDADDDEEVDNVNGEPESTGRLTSTEGEIDGHEQGEDDADEDDDGETGEEEQGIEDGIDFDDEDDAEDEDDAGFLVQPVDGRAVGSASGSVLEDEVEDGDIVLEDEVEDDDSDEDGEVQEVAEPPPAQKRKRDEEDSSNGNDAEPKSSSKKR